MTSDFKLIDHPASWTASELRQNPDWIYKLSAEEILEIDTAIKSCKTIDLFSIKQTEFSLPKLSKTISEKFLPQLENGIGTLLLRGIDVNQFSLENLNKLFWGLGLYFGTAVSQSTAGELLQEVKDQGYRDGDNQARGVNRNIKLWFHNDFCDVAALFCIRRAKSGGETQLVSSVSIHNKLLQNAPELLEELYQPYYFRRHNVDTANANEFSLRPIFAFEQGHFVCNMLRPLIDHAQYSPNIPKMSSNQIRALDMFDAIAECSELCHEFALETGDIIFFNNYVTLHSRQAFSDYAETEKKRLLLRLWLSVANSRPLPESYRDTYREIASGAIRGGMIPIKNNL